jgi:hypothetical protein
MTRKLQEFYKKSKLFFISLNFVYYLSLISLPIAGYLFGKSNATQIENPKIVIDTSQIDCNCPTIEAKIKQESEQKIENPNQNSQFVASQNGSKYYPLDCSYTNRIKEENKIFYRSEQEAEKDGKERSAMCK